METTCNFAGIGSNPWLIIGDLNESQIQMRRYQEVHAIQLTISINLVNVLFLLIQVTLATLLPDTIKENAMFAWLDFELADHLCFRCILILF